MKIPRNFLAIILAAALLCTLGLILLGPLADWLVATARFPHLPPALEIQAVDDARGRLLQLAAGIVAVGALFYNARNHALARRTYELTEQGQVTDRYTTSVEQLASESIGVRLGGIYALERISRDSPEDHQTIVDVLCAFIRSYSPPTESDHVDEFTQPPLPADIQAAVQVMGRRDRRRDRLPLDLRGANLRGLELYDADLSGCYMPNADLTRVSFHRVSLKDSRLMWVKLGQAHLVDVDMSGSLLTRSYFVDTEMHQVDLTKANLSNYSNLSGADMRRVTLSDANLEDADLSGCQFREMELAGVDFGVTDLSGADLSDTNGLTAGSFRDALVDEDTRRPDHLAWSRDTRSVIENEIDA